MNHGAGPMSSLEKAPIPVSSPINPFIFFIMQKKAFYILLVSAMIFGSCHVQRHLSNSTTGIPAATGIQKVGHVVVIYMENHSFDNLYGQFEGADGLSVGKSSIIQVDTHGTVYPFLPALAH